jgi:hypothetical protein
MMELYKVPLQLLRPLLCDQVPYMPFVMLPSEGMDRVRLCLSI